MSARCACLHQGTRPSGHRQTSGAAPGPARVHQGAEGMAMSLEGCLTRAESARAASARRTTYPFARGVSFAPIHSKCGHVGRAALGRGAARPALAAADCVSRCAAYAQYLRHATKSWPLQHVLACPTRDRRGLPLRTGPGARQRQGAATAPRRNPAVPSPRALRMWQPSLVPTACRLPMVRRLGLHAARARRRDVGRAPKHGVAAGAPARRTPPRNARTDNVQRRWPRRAALVSGLRQRRRPALILLLLRGHLRGHDRLQVRQARHQRPRRRRARACRARARRACARRGSRARPGRARAARRAARPTTGHRRGCGRRALRQAPHGSVVSRRRRGRARACSRALLAAVRGCAGRGARLLRALAALRTLRARAQHVGQLQAGPPLHALLRALARRRRLLRAPQVPHSGRAPRPSAPRPAQVGRGGGQRGALARRCGSPDAGAGGRPCGPPGSCCRPRGRLHGVARGARRRPPITVCCCGGRRLRRRRGVRRRAGGRRRRRQRRRCGAGRPLGQRAAGRLIDRLHAAAQAQRAPVLPYPNPMSLAVPQEHRAKQAKQTSAGHRRACRARLLRRGLKRAR